MKRLLVQLDGPVHERLKRLSFTHHRSMSSIVRELVRAGLSQPLADRGRRRADVGKVARTRKTRRS